MPKLTRPLAPSATSCAMAADYARTVAARRRGTQPGAAGDNRLRGKAGDRGDRH